MQKQLARQYLGGGVNVRPLERWLSALGGGALIANGLRRPTALNILLAAGGAALLERAVTGHCPLYARMGIDQIHGGRHHDHHVRADDDKYRYGSGPRGTRSVHDLIDEASQESFPASDPPSWTPTSALGSPKATAH